MKKPTKILTFILLGLFISGCSWLAPHKRDIQQGNLLDEKDVQQLEVGMRQDQVKYLLGTPLLTPLGQPNQWDYVYQLRRGQDLLARKRVTLTFAQADDNRLRLAKIDHHKEVGNPSLLEELTPSTDEGPATVIDEPAINEQPGVPPGGSQF